MLFFVVFCIPIYHFTVSWWFCRFFFPILMAHSVSSIYLIIFLFIFSPVILRFWQTTWQIFIATVTNFRSLKNNEVRFKLWELVTFRHHIQTFCFFSFSPSGLCDLTFGSAHVCALILPEYPVLPERAINICSCLKHA